MTVLISKPAINLREELASLRNQGGLPKEDKLYLDDFLDNGTFDSGTTGWISVGEATATISNNAILVAGSSNPINGGIASQLTGTKKDKAYKVTFDLVAEVGSGLAYVRQGTASTLASGTDIFAESSLSVGTHSAVFLAKADDVYLQFYTYQSSGGARSFTLDNISVQEVGENLVTNGTFDTDSGWTQLDSGATISGGVLNLNGTPNADACRQDISIVAGKTYHLSWEIKSINQTGTPEIGLKLGGSTIHTASTVGVHTATAVATSTGNVQVYVTGNPVGTLDNIMVTEGSHQVIQSIPHGYDVKDVYIDGELAREGEAYDYEVKTDGINQWLKPTVEPTATTETVVIGVRK
jgi:hypothetical protein